MKLTLVFLFLVTGCQDFYLNVKKLKSSSASEILSIIPPPSGHYKEGDVLTITVRYPEGVTVAGSPQLPVQIGSTIIPFVFSGVSSTDVSFSYTIQNTDNDNDGIALAGDLDLNSGSIKEPNGANANIQMPANHMSSVIVDTIRPTISLATTIPDGVYGVGTMLDFELTFSEAVNVVNQPYLDVTIGATPRQAVYHSSPSPNVKVFRYVSLISDNDPDGISSSSPLELGTGSLKDLAGNDALLTFTPPDTSGIIFDNTIPGIISVTAPSNGTYNNTDLLDFMVTFSEAVTITGSPRIAIDVGGSTFYAVATTSASSATHNFRYTVGAAENDTDGIALTSPMELNSGTIQDATGNNSSLSFTLPNTAGIIIDNTAPTILNVTPPGNASYLAAANLDFIVTFSEAVVITGSPRIAISVGADTRYATATTNSSSTTHTFRYTVGSENDTDGITLTSPMELNSGTIKDVAGNDSTLSFTLPMTTGILVDTTIPSILSIAPPTDGTYIAGTNLDFTATFSEAVAITGSPRIAITVGGATRYAIATTTSSSATHNFRYTVLTGDEDNDGILLASPMELNSGTITDAAGNNSTLTFTLPATAGVRVDATNPTILSISFPSNGLYYTGENLDYVVTFSEAVSVTATPQLTLTLDSGSIVANAITSASATTHTFRRTITSTDYSYTTTAVSPLQLNGGTINDSAGNNAILTFTPPTYNWPDAHCVNRPEATGQITGVTPLNDGSGKFYLWGKIGNYCGIQTRGITRLLPNFKHDATYASSNGPNNDVMSLVVAQDNSGAIYAGGCFSTFRGTTVNGIVKINSAGARDGSFNVGTGFDIVDPGNTVLYCSGVKTVKQILHTNDGSNDIFVVGKFDSYNGTTRRNLIRLNSNGTVDSAFDVGTKFNAGSSINSIALARDGSGDIIVGGDFTTYDGVGVDALIRLNSAGIRVGNIGTLPDPVEVNKVMNSPEDSDDFYVMADNNSLSTYDGVNIRGLFRINSDATRDIGFVSTVGFPQHRTPLNMNRDVFDSSSIYVSGVELSSWNGGTDYSEGVRKIQSDGTQYPSSVFPGNNIGFTGSNGTVHGTAQDAMGRGLVLAVGDFSHYNNRGVFYIVVIDEKGYSGGNAPYITNMSATNANNTIGTPISVAGTNVDITLTFSEAVTVTGSPRIKLNTSSPGAPRYATYLSGTGTATLTFRNITASGDTSGTQELTHIDENSLFLNSGSIMSVANPTRASSLLLPLPYHSNSLTLNKDIFINVP